MRRTMHAWLLACPLSFACDSVEPTTTGLLKDGSVSTPEDDGVCMPQECRCGGSAGIRECTDDGELGECDCETETDPADGSARVVCLPGVYRGTFQGKAGLFGSATTDVAGFDAFNAQPGLELTLVQGEAGEFSLLGNGT